MNVKFFVNMCRVLRRVFYKTIQNETIYNWNVIVHCNNDYGYS